ncbi:MAG: biotin--[acetyl-CoA-carboxylase] ligase [Mycetocola sp.]
MSTHSDYPLTSAIASRLIAVGAVGSTSDELARALGDDPQLPDGTTVLSVEQNGGRGRQGRVWEAPAGAMLALSTLIDVDVIPVERLGWLPLLVGVAVCDALEDVAPGFDARLKWPNDVLVDGLKISGILCELREGSPRRVVVGTGINTAMTDEQRPVDSATSLVMRGIHDVPNDRVASAYLARLAGLVDDWKAAGGDPVASGVRERVEALCSTLGRRVRAIRPADECVGTATGIDESGQLIITADDGTVTVVGAGDVTHLRPL